MIMKKKKSIIEIIALVLLAIAGLIAFLNVAEACSGYKDITDIMNGISQGLNNCSKPFEHIELNKQTIKNAMIYALIVGVAYLYYFTSLKKTRKGEEHGTARWGNVKEIKKFADKDKKKNIIIANGIEMSLNARKIRRNLNVLILGGSGTGKSRFYCKPNIMQMNSSYVITDPKGENFRDTAKMLEDGGYEVKVLNLVEMEKSDGYNPFKYIKNDNDVLIMIKGLIKNTTPDKASSGDPFWEKSETALLQAISFYLLEQPVSEEVEWLPVNMNSFFKMVCMSNVKDVTEYESVTESEANRYFAYVKENDGFKGMEEINQEFFNQNGYTVTQINDAVYKADANGKVLEKEDEFDKRFRLLEEQHPNNLGVASYKVFKLAPKKTAMSILISLGVRLAPFNVPGVKKILETDTLELEKLGERKQAMYVIIPDSDDTFNFLAAMMYSQLFITLYREADFGNTQIDRNSLDFLGNKFRMAKERDEIEQHLDKAIDEEKEKLLTRLKEFGHKELKKDFYLNPCEYVSKQLNGIKDGTVNWKASNSDLKAVYNIQKYSSKNKYTKFLADWTESMADAEMGTELRLNELYSQYSFFADHISKASVIRKKEYINKMNLYSELIALEYGIKKPSGTSEVNQNKYYDAVDRKISEIRGSLENRGRLKVPVRCILDEFANLGQIPDFSKLVATMRSREISVNIIIQDLSQLKKIHEKDWQSIVGNCDTFLFLGSQETESAKYLSEKLGKETLDKKSTSQSKGKSGSSSTSWDVLGRELMMVDEITRMDDNECLVTIRGQYPFKVKKYDITKHPNYKKILDYSPRNKYVQTRNINDIYEAKLIEYEEKRKEQLQLIEDKKAEQEKEMVQRNWEEDFIIQCSAKREQEKQEEIMSQISEQELSVEMQGNIESVFEQSLDLFGMIEKKREPINEEQPAQLIEIGDVTDNIMDVVPENQIVTEEDAEGDVLNELDVISEKEILKEQEQIQAEKVKEIRSEVVAAAVDAALSSDLMQSLDELDDREYM